MDFVVFSLGTYGDNLPFISLCEELQKQKKEVVFLGNEKFKSLCKSRSVDCISVSALSDYEAVYGNLSTWSAAHSDRHYIDFHLPAIKATFVEIEKIVQSGSKPVVVYQDPLSGAKLAAERYNLSQCRAVLAPSSVYSAISPPFPFREQIRECDWEEGMVIARKKSRESSYTKIVSPYLNTLRKEFGLKEWRQNDLNDLEKCDVYFGLFPGWLKPRPSDWDASFVACGFPNSESTRQGLSPELLDFLQSNPKPIVATFGSGLPPTRGNINKLAKVGEKLGKGVVFVTPKQPGDEDYRELDNLILLREADYSQLFPKASIVMHHGGIGTCADCLRAGVPQLITPFNFDQPDNAFLIYELGVGNAITFVEASVSEIAEQVQSLSNSKEIAQKCTQLQSKCFNENGNRKATQLLLQIS